MYNQPLFMNMIQSVYPCLYTKYIARIRHTVTSLSVQTNFTEITLPRGCSSVALHICRTVVLTNTCGEQLLQIFIQHVCHIFQYKFVSNLGCFILYFWVVQCSLQKEQSFVFQYFICSCSESIHVNCIL